MMALEGICAVGAKVVEEEQEQADSAYLLNSYLQVLEMLARERDSLSTVGTYPPPTPTTSRYSPNLPSTHRQCIR